MRQALILLDHDPKDTDMPIAGIRIGDHEEELHSPVEGLVAEDVPCTIIDLELDNEDEAVLDGLLALDDMLAGLSSDAYAEYVIARLMRMAFEEGRKHPLGG